MTSYSSILQEANFGVNTRHVGVSEGKLDISLNAESSGIAHHKLSRFCAPPGQITRASEGGFYQADAGALGTFTSILGLL